MTAESFVSRINQIDAILLDNEIYKLLKNQINEILKYFPATHVILWEPELDVVIKYLIWHYSLNKGSSTFGQDMLNLSYKNLDKKKAILLFLCSTIPNYLQKRLINENFILSRVASNESNYKYYIDHIANFLNLLDFIWKLFFLYYGNYPRCIEKILGIPNQSLNMNKPRSIGFSYMTKELLWHALIELFSVGLPMIDFRRIQRIWRKIWSSKKKKENFLECYKLDETSVCSYCNERPILPHWAGCPHVFCYYCLQAHFTETESYQCPVCDHELYSANMKNQITV